MVLFFSEKTTDGFEIILKKFFLANFINLKFSTENCSLKIQSKLLKFSGTCLMIFFFKDSKPLKLPLDIIYALELKFS